MQRQCVEACAVAYVTEKHLQKRYPAAPAAFVTHYSSVELPKPAFVAAPRVITEPLHSANLIQVGTQSQLYKGQDVLLSALKIVLNRGFDIRLTLVGDGRYRGELEARAMNQGTSQQVRFLGQLPAGEAVRCELDAASLFIMPSRTEGLPRAMIEAMARALPCIGSNVGGIPELLPSSDMVQPGDVEGLADKIEEVLSSAQRLTEMSDRNLRRAQEFSDEALRKRRIEFYRQVKMRTVAERAC
jgi:glycosyltransferase involved in cell wall biosynthesis